MNNGTWRFINLGIMTELSGNILGDSSHQKESKVILLFEDASEITKNEGGSSDLYE